MSSLSNIEKLKFEKIFDMSGGSVLKFTNPSFQRFINDSLKIDIYNAKYEKNGTSKANRLRTFWIDEIDSKVGKLNEELLLSWESNKQMDNEIISKSEKNLFDECIAISYRLQGKSFKEKENTVEDFLKKEVDEIQINQLNIDSTAITVLEERIIEVKQCLNAGASLSVIFLCGSILEGILLGTASKFPSEFNQSPSSPKDNTGKVKQLHEWTLNNFIEVAHNIGYIGLDVKKYSHALRDFRNYIHPYQQMASKFKPDLHTAKISWQVLKAAMNDLHKKSK
jgi:hypothetical protein